MLKKLLLSAWFLAYAFSYSFAQDELTFASYPTLSPDGGTLVFSYDGDLWKAGVEGGQAYRLTAMSGNEIAPRISPDGKWLAFSSNQNGNPDVYVMPLEGGEIRQLTHHSSTDLVDSWSWDSKEIYFTSSRANRFTSFKVNVEGGTPKRVFKHYFNTIHNVVETPQGDLLFNDTWESFSAANRKRYKGEFNPDILAYHPKTKTYKELTQYEGKDFWASVDKKANVYFASDEGNDEYNLYTFLKGEKTALTSFNTSIKRPFVSANGEKVVFEKDYELYLYDVESKRIHKPKIRLGKNNILGKEREYNVKDKISYMDISKDGKKIAFVSRGELFVSDIKGKFVRQMPDSGERIGEVKWLEDNKTLLYNQTYKGFFNWYVRSADGKGDVKQLTKDLRSNRDMTFNTDYTKAVYASGRDEIRLLDLKSFESTAVINDEIWAFQNSKPSFSPDGKYLLYTARRNFEEDIFVYHIESGETLNLTNTGVSETSPYWSPDGKYIYFASNRTKPSYPIGMHNSSIYRLALDYFDEPYRSEKFDEMFAEKEEQKKEKAKKDYSENKSKKDSITISIAKEGLYNRIEQVSPTFGTQQYPVVFEEGSKTHVVYFSNQNEGKSAVYKTTYEPFESRKTEKLFDSAYTNIVKRSSTFYVLRRGGIHKLNIEKGKLDKINISYTFRRNLEQEFKQMFEETWAGIDENFYDQNFHSLDWTQVYEQYSSYLSAVNSRADLRVLLNDMLGELNSSHLGFSSSGREESTGFTTVSNEIGVVFDNGDPYKVSHILQNGPAGRKGVDIQVGDILRSVNKEKVNPEKDRDVYFSFPTLMEELTLSFERNGQVIETQVRPQTNAAFKELLYDEWIENNRIRTDELSNNRIAYVHMKDMSGGELERFLINMTRYENQTEATILDLRYNTGGNVHDQVLQFLSQKPYLNWQYREGKRSPQSNFSPAGKPIVLLVNQQSLSDAEMTAAGFKSLKLGKIIGTETYRWIIFTSAKSLVDGSSYRVPAWGVYTLEGDDLELTGVRPDIYVKNTFINKLKGEDPQLETAVEEILKEIGKE